MSSGKQLRETAVGRFLEKMYPNFEQHLESDERLVEIELTGSINTSIYGISSQTTNWVNHAGYDSLLLAGQEGSKARAWAQRMVVQRSFSLLPVQKDLLLTNSPSNNFFANDQRTVADIDLAHHGVGTEVNELAGYAAILTGSTCTPLSTDLSSVKTTQQGNQYTGGSKMFLVCKDLNDYAQTMAHAMVSTLGYQFAKDMPVLAAPELHSISTYNDDDVPMSKVDDILGIGAVGGGGSSDERFLGYSAAEIKLALSCAPPGIKYIPFVIGTGGSTSMAFWTGIYGVTHPGASLETSVQNAKRGWIAIPVLDDGNIMSYGVRVWNEMIKLYSLRDYRYTMDVVNDRPAITYNPELIKLVLGTDSFAKADGSVIDFSNLPPNGWEDIHSTIGDTFLPLMCAPLPDQHYVCSLQQRTSEVYTSGDKEVVVDKITLMVRFAAYKMAKEWYVDYYQTGFGLYAPRSSNIQRNILDKWNKLDFNYFGICIDQANSQVSPEIVFDTDIAREYKRKRERACKENDWLTQKFAGDVTYGEIRNRIIARPTVRAFYCITQLSPTPSFIQSDDFLSDVTWSKVEGVYTRTDGDLQESYEINTTTRDLLMVEVSQGATLTISIDTIIADFGLDSEEASAFSSVIAELRDPYSTEKPIVRGLKMKQQYFSPLEALSNSGYPVLRYMHGVYRNTLLMRNYYDLQSIGDPLIRIIESFNAAKITAKLYA